MAAAKTIARVLLVGPGAAIAAVASMLGMALWLPAGAGGIDNMVVPLIVAPLIWAGLFFHAWLDPRLWRVALVALLLTVASGALIARQFLAPSSSPSTTPTGAAR
jgi:hypothetical protein